ncbi:MAG: hypothetical protein NZ898_03965 [Myxococcota bacterium]|nr:hypothetical protein [Myxococcota bacterium]MDW8362923.1 hypothetical protein [Myxococcales bacterium]
MARTITRALALTALGFSAWPLASSQARAQEQVEANFKGAVGLGLVGAEIGFVVPAAIGMEEVWPYAVFPVVGAAGGAIGGYFALDATGQTELSIAALALGMALAIPATVLTLSLTAYDPADEGIEVQGPPPDEGVPIEELDPDVTPPSASPGARRSAAGVTASLRSGPGLLRISPAGSWLALPVVGIGATPEGDAIAVRVPLISGVF